MTVPFVYQRAESVEDAVVRLAEPRTLPMGGGTDLLVTIDEGIYAPAAVVDLRAVPASDSVELREDGTLRIGASARIEHLANHPLIRERYGALAEACSVVATPALREMGTLGGNLCQWPDMSDRAVFAIRTTVPPATLVPPARAIILGELPKVRIRHLMPMSDLLSMTHAGCWRAARRRRESRRRPRVRTPRDGRSMVWSAPCRRGKRSG